MNSPSHTYPYGTRSKQSVVQSDPTSASATSLPASVLATENSAQKNSDSATKAIAAKFKPRRGRPRSTLGSTDAPNVVAIENNISRTRGSEPNQPEISDENDIYEPYAPTVSQQHVLPSNDHDIHPSELPSRQYQLDVTHIASSEMATIWISAQLSDQKVKEALEIAFIGRVPGSTTEIELSVSQPMQPEGILILNKVHLKFGKEVPYNIISKVHRAVKETTRPREQFTA